MLTDIPASASAAALYTGLLILMGLYLQGRVIGLRRSRKIGLGDGQDKELMRAIRVHGNFVESAAFGIGALIMLALIAAPAAVIHGVGAMLFAGRIAHAYGLTRTAGSSPGRVAGMVLSLTALGLAGLILIVRAIW